MINNYNNSVFTHRYRDKMAEIRTACMEEFGLWVSRYPIFFLDDTHLKYIGWTLNDRVFFFSLFSSLFLPLSFLLCSFVLFSSLFSSLSSASSMYLFLSFASLLLMVCEGVRSERECREGSGDQVVRRH